MPTILPVLERHLKPLVLSRFVRVRARDFSTDQPAFVEGRAEYYSRCTLMIQYCGEPLCWHVVYSLTNPTHAPDILFGEADSDFIRFMIANGHHSSLTNGTWDAARDDALHGAVRELVELYRLFQLETVATTGFADDRLTIEFDTIRHTDQVCFRPSQNEMCCTVPIVADFSRLPIDVNGTPHIYARLSSQASPKVTIRFLPACLRGVKLPAWVKNATLAEFHPFVDKAIEQEIAFAEQRLKFFELLDERMNGKLEYDTEGFYSSSYLFEIGTPGGDELYPFVVKVGVDRTFPQASAPTISLASVYHVRNNKPYTSIIKKFPFSSAWSLEKIAQSVVDSIHKGMPQFYRLCNAEK